MASILLVTLHLLAAQVAAAGPLAALGLRYLARRANDPQLDAMGREVAWWSVAGLGLAAVLGAAQLGLLWQGNVSAYLDALAAVPTSRLWWGAVELGVSATLLVAYGLCWRWPQKRFAWHSLLAIGSAANLLYHFPALFSIVAIVSTRPELQDSPLEFRDLLFSGETLARVAHHVLAALSMAGVAAMAVAVRHWPSPPAARAATFGARMALTGVSLQIFAGPMVLAFMPAPLQSRMLGGDTLTTCLLAASVALTFWMTQSLAQASAGAVTRGTAMRLILLVAATIGLMVATRHESRRPYYDASAASKGQSAEDAS